MLQYNIEPAHPDIPPFSILSLSSVIIPEREIGESPTDSVILELVDPEVPGGEEPLELREAEVGLLDRHQGPLVHRQS